MVLLLFFVTFTDYYSSVKVVDAAPTTIPVLTSHPGLIYAQWDEIILVYCFKTNFSHENTPSHVGFNKTKHVYVFLRITKRRKQKITILRNNNKMSNFLIHWS